MEYLNPYYKNVMQRRFQSPKDNIAYWRDVKRYRTSSNGLFGFKMFVTNYMDAKRDFPELLPCITPSKVLFLTRRDKVAQAISYSRAIRSGAWFDGVTPKELPEYDAEHIATCMAGLEYQMQFWKRLFTSTGAPVYSMTYEDLLENRAEAVRGALDFLGVEPGAARVVVRLPEMKQQRNSESTEWADRFQSDVKQALRSAMNNASVAVGSSDDVLPDHRGEQQLD